MLPALGYDDVLYCDLPSGPGKENTLDREVLEAARANFFIVDKNGTVVTPDVGVLLGITRKVVLLLVYENFPAEESPIFLKDIMDAREAFITNTTKGVWPVITVDEKRFEVGPVTLKLRKMFNNYRNNYFKNHRK
jgi:branched-subunit amino acid aminotransferase/4-amino-4-deoxychorismate lyase